MKLDALLSSFETMLPASWRGKLSLPHGKKSPVPQKEPAPKKDTAYISAFLEKNFKLDLRVKDASSYFSGAIFEKALSSLDRSTLLIIGVAWLVALTACGLAFITTREAAELKMRAETARALEPILPKINRLLLTKEQYEPLTVRLKKQFPAITFEVSGKPTLQIKSNDASQFMDWLNAVSYVDSMVPSIRWTLIYMCVGPECPGEHLMLADLTAEAINIAQPEQRP
jgi:hypothetical protein